MKPRLFIGSSTENLDIAYALQENLDNDAVVTVWKQAVFGLSKTNLDSLLEVLRKSDFAIFVLAGEDYTKIRDIAFSCARDNVLFELGLFFGFLGRERTIFVTPSNISGFRIPTDLLGINYATFDSTRDDQNLPAALGTACQQIRRCIKNYRSRLTVESRLYTLIGLFNEEPVEFGEGPFQSFRYHTTSNINPVANLWADPSPGNCVSANLCQAPKGKSSLKVVFECAPGCNVPAVGIHPEGLKARLLPSNCSKLCFKGRLLLCGEENDSCSRAVGIG